MDPDPTPAGQAAAERAEAKREAANAKAMNTWLRGARGTSLSTTTRFSRRRRQAASEGDRAPRLIDLFRGRGLSAEQQARCLRLVAGEGKDAKGKPLPKMTGAAAIAIVKPKFPRGDAGTGQGGIPPPAKDMNWWIRAKSGR